MSPGVCILSTCNYKIPTVIDQQASLLHERHFQERNVWENWEMIDIDSCYLEQTKQKLHLIGYLIRNGTASWISLMSLLKEGDSA